MSSDDDSSSASEESFHRVVKKNKARVVDSDSDESHREEATIKDSDLDDSLAEETPVSTHKKRASEDFVDTTDDEDDNFKPQVSQEDITDFTDDEDTDNKTSESLYENAINNESNVDSFFDQNNAVANSTMAKENVASSTNIDSFLEKTSFVANTTMYRTRKEESSDDEEELPRSRIQDSSDDDLPQSKLTVDEDDNRNGISESSGSVEVEEDIGDIVEVSSEDEAAGAKRKQTSIKSFMKTPQKHIKSEKGTVTHEEHQMQIAKVNSIESELLRAKNAIRIINLQTLPDKGKTLLQKEQSLNIALQEERRKLAEMVIEDKLPMRVKDKVEVAWDEIQAGVNDVGPRVIGSKGVARFNVEKQLAVETLAGLHKSLDTCPTENDVAEDPKGLKIPLMLHQKRALTWLLWREKQKPSGGLLADDMGLGKTLTMISLIMKSREIYPDDELDKENYRDKYPGGTLVVCPASLINQWAGEIEKRTKRGLLDVELHHGAKRETKSKRLARHDVVITTYGLVLSDKDKTGSVFGVRWRRIILDEAHQIRNHKSQTSEAVFRLSGKSRWALTGTPVHNKELDMYAILKYLRCAPFDDLQVWKRWMADKTTGGEMRMHAVICSLMLRRTKVELMQKNVLQSLPEKKWELISLKLGKEETNVYQKVLIFSQTLFAQFLHQRAEKNQDAYDLKFTGGAPSGPNAEYFKMRNKLLKLNRVKEVSQHEILVLLLRLRQICCHPFLIKEMLHGDEDLGDVDNHEDAEEMNLLEQLNKLNMDDEEEHVAAGRSDEKLGLKEASKGFLNPSNPVFRAETPSTKIKVLVDMLKEKIANTDDKIIVVSQWTSLLGLVAIHLKAEYIKFDTLSGKIPVNKRMPIVDNFNSPRSDTKVLLLSLTAGGVGLNLVGANHLFLLDLHWNPQLESQAQDRIYRMGQTKPIFVYKFMALDTIEQRIKSMQDSKLEISNAMLTGSKRVTDNKLSLQDLKMLFGFTN